MTRVTRVTRAVRVTRVTRVMRVTRVTRVMLVIAISVCLFTPAFAGQIPQTDQLSNVKGLVDQARTAFDALDYENTIKALDSAIAAVEARPTPELRRLL